MITIDNFDALDEFVAFLRGEVPQVAYIKRLAVSIDELYDIYDSWCDWLHFTLPIVEVDVSEDFE